MNRLCQEFGKVSNIKNNLRGLNTFSKSNRGSFFQVEPALSNQYDADAFLREQLTLEIPKEV
jgi:hypothetical protein